MRWIVFFIAVLLLAGCEEDKSPLTPFQCRVNGVMVEDDDTVTGIITREAYFQTVSEVAAACLRPFSQDSYGCTIALNPGPPGEYMIVYYPMAGMPINYQTPKQHERCHAYYEEWRHMP